MGRFGKTDKRQADTELDLNNLPRHVAIIMDGNGRWAKKRLMPRFAGHKAGLETVKKIMRQSSDLGIKYLTLYAFSTENWKRPDEEVGFLMKLIIDAIQKEIDEMIEENVIFDTIGDIENLPKPVYEMLESAKERTKENTGLRTIFALNYGGRGEIVRAAKTIAQDAADGKIQIEEIDEERIAGSLYTAGIPDPDLMIRTSGEERLSNFLLYQLAYAEFYFTPVFWPDFDAGEYEKALLKYQARNRRYGGL